MSAKPQTPFGDYLDQLLDERGLSVRAFAALVNVPPGSISVAKRNTMNPKRMESWADALELTGEVRVRFCDLASLTHAPEYLVQRLEQLIAENKRLKTARDRARG